MLTYWLLPLGVNFEDMDNWMKCRFQFKKTAFQYINPGLSFFLHIKSRNSTTAISDATAR